MTRRPKLLGCPFCGSPPEIFSGLRLDDGTMSGPFIIACPVIRFDGNLDDSCGAGRSGFTLKIAATRWNARADCGPSPKRKPKT